MPANQQRYALRGGNRELIMRKSTAEAVATRIVEKNWSTAEDFDPIQSVYLSPDRFGKEKLEGSIATQMGDVFSAVGMPRPMRAVNDRVDGWRLCFSLFETDELAILDRCTDMIESIPKLMRDEKDPEDAEKEGDDLFLDACEASLRRDELRRKRAGARRSADR